jgi:hypothetical protein
VVNLVLGSFVVVLAPVAVGWAFKLVSGIAHWVAVGLSRAVEDVKPWGPRRSLNFNPSAGCIAMARKTLSPEIERSWVPERRRRR